MNFDQLPKHEGEVRKRSPIPTYDSKAQRSVSANGMEETSYKDAELYTVAVERTRALRTMDPDRGRLALGGEGLQWAFEHIDPDVGRAFDAHGIAKMDPVKKLDDILRQGFSSDRTLYTTAFLDQPEAGAAIGADHPFTEGGVVLVSGPGQRLRDGVKFVVLGEEYSGVIDILRKRYPGATIVPWHDAPRILTESYNESTGEHRAYAEVTADNAPAYEPPLRPGDRARLSQSPVEIPGAPKGDSEVDIW